MRWNRYTNRTKCVSIYCMPRPHDLNKRGNSALSETYLLSVEHQVSVSVLACVLYKTRKNSDMLLTLRPNIRALQYFIFTIIFVFLFVYVLLFMQHRTIIIDLCAPYSIRKMYIQKFNENIFHANTSLFVVVSRK